MTCGLGDRTLGDSEAFGVGFQLGDGIDNAFRIILSVIRGTLALII
jgi:hypothetical protein